MGHARTLESYGMAPFVLSSHERTRLALTTVPTGFGIACRAKFKPKRGNRRHASKRHQPA